MNFNHKFAEEIKSIESILKKYKIKNYEIKEGKVNVNGDVDLSNKGLGTIPVQFEKVSGDFNCSKNQLISLKGVPKEVGGNFYCDPKHVRSLYGPRKIGGIMLLIECLF